MIELLTQYDFAKILSYLHDPVDFVRIRGVCSTWRAAVPEPRLGGKTVAEICRGYPHDAFICGCEYNSNELVKFAMSREVDDYGTGLIYSCRGGNREIAELMISLGARNYNEGFYEACFSGSNELIDLLIARGATHWAGGIYAAARAGRINIIYKVLTYHSDNMQAGVSVRPINWREAFIESCECGNREVMDLAFKNAFGTQHLTEGLIRACTTNCAEAVRVIIEKRVPVNWHIGLAIASESQNMEIIKLILSQYPHVSASCFVSVCKSGNRAIIDLCMQYGANYWREGFTAACEYGRLEVAREMIRRGAVPPRDSLAQVCRVGGLELAKLVLPYCKKHREKCLNIAYRSKHFDIVRLLIDNNVNSLNNLFCLACEHNNLRVIGYVLSGGECDWNEGLARACAGGHQNIIDMMLAKGAHKLEYALGAACARKTYKIIPFLIKKGAMYCAYCKRTAPEHFE